VAEAIVNVTEGSGKKLHAWDRVIGANTVLDEFTLPGEYPYASYFVSAISVSIATANDHVLQLMAGSTLKVKIRRIRIDQIINASAVALGQFEVVRLTTAGTGGTAVTPAPLDTSDAASGATARTLTTVKGTEGAVLFRETVTMRAAVQSTAEDYALWEQHPGEKPIIIPAGTANGIAIKSITAIANATVVARIEFVEQNF
jgi:hypothetical protein